MFAIASRAFPNQLLRFCPGSHLQILFKVEVMRGVFSRLLHFDRRIGTKKKSPHSPFAHTRTLNEDLLYIEDTCVCNIAISV